MTDMMLLKTYLWLMLVYKYLPGEAYMLMDSEDNYVPPDTNEDVQQEGINGIEPTCPILYPRYPYAFGLKSHEQSFHYKCNPKLPFPNSSLSPDEHINSDTLQNPHIETVDDTISHVIDTNINTKIEGSENRDNEIPHDIENGETTDQIEVTNTESNITENYRDISIDNTQTAQQDEHIVKEIPIGKVVTEGSNVFENVSDPTEQDERSKSVEENKSTYDNLEKPSEIPEKRQEEKSSSVGMNDLKDTVPMIEEEQEQNITDVLTQTKLESEKPSVVVKENDTEPEFASFRQWTRQQEEKKLAEEKRKKQTVSLQMKKNFASTDCGAKVVGANIESQGAPKIILTPKDEYMLNQCKDKGWFVVELCESIKAHKIEIANFELFSSVFKNFRVSLGSMYPGKSKDWSTFGEFEAQDLRESQTFENVMGVFGKYVKVEIASHYGTEHYCPISLFKIYGISEIESAMDDDDDQDPSNEPPTIIAETDQPNEPSNMITIIQRKVGQTIENLKGVFTAQDQIRDPDDTQKTQNEDKLLGTTFKYQILCPECDDERLQETKLLVSEDFQDLLNTLKNPSLEYALSTQICGSYGFNLTSRIQGTCLGYQLLEFFKVLFGTSRIIALCNVIAWQEGLLEEAAHPQENLTYDETALNSHQTTIHPSMDKNNNDNSNEIIVTVLDSANLATSVHEVKSKNIEMPNIEPQQTIRASIIEAQVNARDESLPPKENISPTPTLSNGERVTTIVDSKPEHPEPIKGINDAQQEEQLPTEKTHILHSNVPEDIPLPDANSRASDLAWPSPVQRDAKEGVWLKLANRIRNLERNVTYSGAYLEELSVRYKKQIEDLQFAVKKSNEALGLSSRYRQEERITVKLLSAEVANLTAKVTNLTVHLEALSSSAVYTHAFFLLLEILIGIFFVVVCCSRWKDTYSQIPPMSTSLQSFSNKDLQIHSNEGESYCTDDIANVGSNLFKRSLEPHFVSDKETNASSSLSSSPIKQKVRRHSLEDLFAIDEEESKGEPYSMSNGDALHLDRRNSMIVLSEPPPLTRKQRKRQRRIARGENRSITNSGSAILSENRVQDINHHGGNIQNSCTTPTSKISSPYHTVHSSKNTSHGKIPWKQVKRTGSVDNLCQEGKFYSNCDVENEQSERAAQAEQNNRFVVQPVVNVYLNSLVGDPLETSNKYDLLNHSVHDDPNNSKEESLSYGSIQNNTAAEIQHLPSNRHKSKNNNRKRQLFADPNNKRTQNGLGTMALNDEGVAEKFNKQQTPIKTKRSKSTSPKRIGETVKQRVVFENFNPNNADWIQKN